MASSAAAAAGLAALRGDKEATERERERAAVCVA
jgi:hypothetical protein